MRAALLGITPQSCGEGANSERFASEPHCRVAVYALFNILFFNTSIYFNLFALRVVWYSFQILDIIRNSHGVFCICCCFVNKEEQGCNQPTSPMIISSVISLCSYSNKSWLQLLYDSFFYFSTLCVCMLIWWWRVGMFLDMRLIYKVANPIKKWLMFSSVTKEKHAWRGHENDFLLNCYYSSACFTWHFCGRMITQFVLGWNECRRPPESRVG